MLEVGVDLVGVCEIERSVDTFGDRYLRRIYTEEELAYAASMGADRLGRLAARFAAKEAVIKVLRPDEESVPWHDIEVCRGPGGACEVKLHGAAADLARKRRVGRISLSLTHNGGYAIAVAAAECSTAHDGA